MNVTKMCECLFLNFLEHEIVCKHKGDEENDGWNHY